MRDEVLSMPAGRELDAVVAERVMGFRWFTSPCANVSVPVADDSWQYLPAFSTDIAAAWKVVERLGEMGYTLDIQWKGKGRVYEFTSEVSASRWDDYGFRDYHAVGSMPYAVCMVALQAVSVDHPRVWYGVLKRV